jgi:hypothetical protein
VRFGWATGGLALIAAVGGCTSSADPKPSPSFVSGVSASAAPHWTEPASYTYVLTRGCDAATPLGRYQVTVKSGEVSESTRVDRPDADPSSSSDVNLGPVTDDGEEIEVPTLAGLLELAQTAADDGGQITEAFDAKDGHPVKVSFNTSDSGDPTKAECFSVSAYQAT